MFNFRQLLSNRHRPKFEKARENGMNLERMHEEEMHNLCELNEKNDIAWSAGMNL